MYFRKTEMPKFVYFMAIFCALMMFSPVVRFKPMRVDESVYVRCREWLVPQLSLRPPKFSISTYTPISELQLLSLQRSRSRVRPSHCWTLIGVRVSVLALMPYKKNPAIYTYSWQLFHKNSDGFLSSKIRSSRKFVRFQEVLAIL